MRIIAGWHKFFNWSTYLDDIQCNQRKLIAEQTLVPPRGPRCLFSNSSVRLVSLKVCSPLSLLLKTSEAATDKYQDECFVRYAERYWQLQNVLNVFSEMQRFSYLFTDTQPCLSASVPDVRVVMCDWILRRSPDCDQFLYQMFSSINFSPSLLITKCN